MEFLNHFSPKIIFHLQLFGIDLSIYNATLTLWAAVAVVAVLFWLASRRCRLYPRGLQNALELLVETLQTYLLDVFEDDKDKARWAPLILSLFLFIFTANLLSLIPGIFPATANINITASLALFIFVLYQAWGIRAQGPKKYMRTFMPSGVSWPLYFLLTPIEIISQLARPFSLAVRLFANILAGHIMSMMFLSLIFIFKSYFVIPFSILAHVMIGLFEIFVSMIQAYIFSYLSAIYISFAGKAEH